MMHCKNSINNLPCRGVKFAEKKLSAAAPLRETILTKTHTNITVHVEHSFYICRKLKWNETVASLRNIDWF